jgi:hypothetical protein
VSQQDAARLIVTLDGRSRSAHEDHGSTRQKKAQARLSGALVVWEALHGLRPGEGLEHARAAARGADVRAVLAEIDEALFGGAVLGGDDPLAGRDEP